MANRGWSGNLSPLNRLRHPKVHQIDSSSQVGAERSFQAVFALSGAIFRVKSIHMCDLKGTEHQDIRQNFANSLEFDEQSFLGQNMKRRFGLDPLRVLELMNVGREPTKRAAGAITFCVISIPSSYTEGISESSAPVVLADLSECAALLRRIGHGLCRTAPEKLRNQ